MADNTTNHTLELLRDIRAAQKDDGAEFRGRFEKFQRQLEELQETVMTSAGFSMHANARHEVVQDEIAKLKQRIAALEEKI